MRPLLSYLSIGVNHPQEKYQLAVDLAEDPGVRALFEKLRDEEAFHVDFLEGEYARLERQMSK